MVSSASQVLQGLCLACILAISIASAPLNVVVTLRGKKYDISASTVSDLQAEVEAQAGLSKDQQSVLYKGKLLSADEDLSSAGISEGDLINVVPSKRPKSERTVSSDGGAAASNPMGGFGDMGGLGGLGGMDMTPEQYEEAMKQMLDSPMMDEFFGSPEKIEESRQAILDNPALKEAMSQLPGFTDMVDDPEKWRESMMQAKEAMEAQRDLMRQQGSMGGGGDDAGDVDDLDDE